MKYVKILGLLAVAATATMAFAGSASATTVTSSGSAYTGKLHAASEGKIAVHFPNGQTAECESTIEAEIETHGSSVTAEGEIDHFTFTGCGVGTHVHVKKPGKLIAHAIAGGAQLTLSGAEFEVTNTSFGITCIYTTGTGLSFGTLTGSSTTGGKATVDMNLVATRTGGSAICGATATWTGSYTVNTPANLNIDSDPPPGTTVTSNGSAYTGEIKAVNENGHVSFHRSTGTTTEHGSGITAEGALSALTFTGCTDGVAVHVKKAGSLVIHSLGNGNGTVTSSGAEIELTDKAWGITCLYTTGAGVDLGTLTGSSTTGSKATLDISVVLPRTGGSSLCGSTTIWTGSYVVNTPANLNID